MTHRPACHDLQLPLGSLGLGHEEQHPVVLIDHQVSGPVVASVHAPIGGDGFQIAFEKPSTGVPLKRLYESANHVSAGKRIQAVSR